MKFKTFYLKMEWGNIACIIMRFLGKDYKDESCCEENCNRKDIVDISIAKIDNAIRSIWFCEKHSYHAHETYDSYSCLFCKNEPILAVGLKIDNRSYNFHVCSSFCGNSVQESLTRMLGIKNKISACSNCKKGESGEKFSFCSRCKRTKYCSIECQKADWSKHKQICNIRK